MVPFSPFCQTHNTPLAWARYLATSNLNTSLGLEWPNALIRDDELELVAITGSVSILLDHPKVFATLSKVFLLFPPKNDFNAPVFSVNKAINWSLRLSWIYLTSFSKAILCQMEVVAISDELFSLF